MLPSKNMFKILPFDKANIEKSYEFLMDSFQISFGPDKELWPNNLGHYEFAKYRDDIFTMLEQSPSSKFFSVWHNSQIVGQIELKQLKKIPSCGYVSFYYLVPEYRNKGYGKFLDEFAINEFRKSGFQKARLTVSEKNPAAQKFYEKSGWSVVGPDPNRPQGITMEKDLS